MKKLHPLLSVLFLIYWGCEDDIGEIDNTIKFLKTYEYLDEGKEVIKNELNEYFILGNKSPTVEDISDGISLMKIDSLGNEIWTKTYNVFPTKIFSSSVDFTNDGGFVISGSSSVLIKTDSEGNMEWNKNYDIQDNLFSVKTTSDNGYIIISEFYIRKTDFYGELEWVYQIEEGGHGNSIIISNDGGYVYTGGHDSNELLIGKINNDGQEEWVRKINNRESTWGFFINNTNDGGYIITGYSEYEQFYGYLLKTDSEGNIQWEKYFDVEFGNSNTTGHSVQQTKDNGYVVVGTSFRSNYSGSVIFLIKFDSEGEVEWKKIVGGENILYIGNSVLQTIDDGFLLTGRYPSETTNHQTFLIKTDLEGNYE